MLIQDPPPQSLLRAISYHADRQVLRPGLASAWPRCANAATSQSAKLLADLADRSMAWRPTMSEKLALVRLWLAQWTASAAASGSRR